MLRWEDADEYSLRSWDFQTGEYKKVYNIDYFDGHVNAGGHVGTSRRQQLRHWVLWW